MRYMTGMPTATHRSSHMTPETLWGFVQDGLSKDYNMGAACQVSHFNMVSGHAYGVIGAVELKGGAHAGQKLIKMRNPWGSNEYDGPWSEKSSLWTADYRKQANGYTNANIGEFFIPIENWLDDYTSLSVNYHQEWHEESFEGHEQKWNDTWNQFNNW